jgi:hypothetical protein
MALIPASTLSRGEVSTLREEHRQVIREVPMAVITVCQLEHIYQGVSRRVVALDITRFTAIPGKCFPLLCQHDGVQLAVGEPQGVIVNGNVIKVVMSSSTFLRPKISQSISM